MRRKPGESGETPTGGSTPTGLARRGPYAPSKVASQARYTSTCRKPPSTHPHTPGGAGGAPAAALTAAGPRRDRPHRTNGKQATSATNIRPLPASPGTGATPGTPVTPSPRRETSNPSALSPLQRQITSPKLLQQQRRPLRACAGQERCLPGFPPRAPLAIGCRKLPSAFVHLRSDAEKGGGGGEQTALPRRSALWGGRGESPLCWGRHLACVRIRSRFRGLLLLLAAQSRGKGEDEGPARAAPMRAEPPRTSLGRR